MTDMTDMTDMTGMTAIGTIDDCVCVWRQLPHKQSKIYVIAVSQQSRQLN